MNNAFHYDVLNSWKHIMFGDIVPLEALNEEISIKDKYTEEYRNFWQYTRNKKKYLVSSDAYKDFPIIPEQTSKLTYRGKVFHVINKYSSVKINPKKEHTIRELANLIFPFGHSNSSHFLLMKLVALTCYFDRLNVRICSGAGFGKNCVFDVLSHLMGDVTKLNPRSVPAVEYRLNNKILVLDELSNLEESQKEMMNNLLLTIGDNTNTYQKGTRGSQAHQSFDTYDISKLSIPILYNNYEYYEEIGQGEKHFDYLFTRAVKDRFLPLRVTGRLDVSQFGHLPNPEMIAEKNKDVLKNVLKSLEYYKQQYKKLELKNRVHDSRPPVSGRGVLHYNKIVRMINHYSESQQEYEKLVSLLDSRIKAYNTGEEAQEVIHETVNL